jgi:hypothetical protein
MSINIEKKLLLEAISGGIDFYKFVIPELTEATPERMENVRNPFYEDKNPSVSIYRELDKQDKLYKWYYKDHGEPEFSGDVFNFAAHYYELTTKMDFPEIMQKMVDDLKIDISEVTYTEEFLSSEYYRTGFEIYDYSKMSGKSQTEHFFKQQYSIPYDICKEYNVTAIKGYRRFNQEAKDTPCYVRAGEYLIAYKADGYAKIYHPATNKKNDKWFSSLGAKPDGFVFGWREIITRVMKYKQPRDILILAGGEKDVLSLATLGYDAITFNSETANIPQSVIEALFPSYDKVIVMYDNDKTGKKRMDEICKQFKLWRVILPTELDGKFGIKDISDCMRCKISKAIIDRLIANAEQPFKNVQPIEKTDAEEIHPDENTIVEPSENDIEPQEDLDDDNSATNYFIPTLVYDQLPPFLKKITALYDDRKDKDIVLLSSLTVLSTCFPKVKGIYDNDPIGTNLYFFISAPPAGGKGKAQWSRKMVSIIDDSLQEQYESDLEQYHIELDKYEKGKADNLEIRKPEKPVQKAILIPGDSSDALLKEILGNNKNFGLLFETEANILSGTFKKEWGDYSTTLRQAFHHERISSGRKGAGLTKADSPHLSVVLTGTPNQITDLIPDVQNGLMSRFLFYSITSDEDFRNPFKSTKDYNVYYQGFSKEVYDWWQIQNDLSKDCHIWLSSDQQSLFVDWFRENMSQLRTLFGNDIDGSVKRMGINHFRICMILTALRQLEANKPLHGDIYVNSIDFITATKIIGTLFKHTSLIFEKMMEGGKGKLKSRSKKLYDQLPSEFTWEQYKELAYKCEIPKGTSEHYLRQFEKNELIYRIKQGCYKKL